MITEIIPTVDHIADLVHANAKEKGFHDEQDLEKFISNQCNNITREVSELWEAFRAGTENEFCDKSEKMRELGLKGLGQAEEELADIIIRCLDVSRRLGIDITNAICTKHIYNTTRPRMHGKKN